jgi:DUF971 family protein
LPRPSRVELGDREVTILWSDGHRSVFSNKNLRDACPCAACKGERGILGKVYLPMVDDQPPADVRATKYAMVGLYAISFVWSDGHSTGIYPYDYLLEICECEACSSESRQ